MTFDIGLVLFILAVSFVLFVTEWLRMDVVALLVLGALTVTGLVTPKDALAGFSNPAVITVWAMFMLSAGLTQTGVADLLGKHTLRLAGRGEARMVAVIMVTSGVLSAFMNNIGVAALMLPVVMDMSRRTGVAASRLLIPLAFGSLLGGLTTLVGTPPNLIASQAMQDHGLRPFALFDFTPVGGIVMLAGIAFVTLWARRWLPRKNPSATRSATPDSVEASNLEEPYALHEQSAVLRIREGAPLAGRTLEESRLGSATGLNVYAVVRGDTPHPVPAPSFRLEVGDRLLVGGKLDRFDELRAWQEVVVEEENPAPEKLQSASLELAELQIPDASELVGRTLREVAFRQEHHAAVLALARGAQLIHRQLADTPLAGGDRLLIEGTRERVESLRMSSLLIPGPDTPPGELTRRYGIDDRLLTVRFADTSVLVGKSVTESRIGDALGLAVIAILRDGNRHLWPGTHEPLRAGDRLVVRGRPEDLSVFYGIQGLEVEQEVPGDVAKQALELGSERIGLVEATLAPRSVLAGKTLRQADFRSRYGLRALAIQRGDRVYRSDLRDRKLRFGDVLLLMGERDRASQLGREPDLLVLSEALGVSRNTSRAPVAAALMIGVLIPVLLGWLPIAVTAVIGATLMVVTGCLTMPEAYRAVEWRAIFLIAGMLPLGVAMQTSGTATLLAESTVSLAAEIGPWGVIVALYVITSMATMVIPTAALIVLMAPVVIKASATLGISPHATMMAVAIAASASFTSPISHPANLLVMGPGGYRFVDYIKIGVPLTLLIGVVTMVVLPWVWPL